MPKLVRLDVAQVSIVFALASDFVALLLGLDVASPMLA